MADNYKSKLVPRGACKRRIYRILHWIPEAAISSQISRKSCDYDDSHQVTPTRTMSSLINSVILVKHEFEKMTT